MVRDQRGKTRSGPKGDMLFEGEGGVGVLYLHKGPD